MKTYRGKLNGRPVLFALNGTRCQWPQLSEVRGGLMVGGYAVPAWFLERRGMIKTCGNVILLD